MPTPTNSKGSPEGLSEAYIGDASPSTLNLIDHDAAMEVGLLPPPPKPDWVAENPALYKKFKPKQKAFLKAYCQTFKVTGACALAKIAHQTHRDWLFNDANYRAAFESCKDMAVTVLEDEAVRRAVEGVPEDVFFKGEVCGTKTVYSDSLLQFLLAGNKPEKYRNRSSVEHSGPGGGPVTIQAIDQILKGDQ